jgi:hypothetical protein
METGNIDNAPPSYNPVEAAEQPSALTASFAHNEMTDYDDALIANSHLKDTVQNLVSTDKPQPSMTMGSQHLIQSP